MGDKENTRHYSLQWDDEGCQCVMYSLYCVGVYSLHFCPKTFIRIEFWTYSKPFHTYRDDQIISILCNLLPSLVCVFLFALHIHHKAKLIRVNDHLR